MQRLWKKGHFEKVCLKAKHSTHSLEVPEASNNSTGEPLYYNDDGLPVYTYMVSVPHVNKHLIKFPIDLDCRKLKGASGPKRNGVETYRNSTMGAAGPHPGPQKNKSVLLKADTGADVNLMNSVTFDSLFDRSVLQLTPIKMENYGNSAVKVLGMFHAFLKWKDRVYR